MGKVKEMSELKKRALLAKQRLRMGYWEKQERERLEMVNGGSALDERGIEELRRAKFRRDALMIIDGDKAKKEEKMYEKVCKILDTDSDTLSPIGQSAADRSIFWSLPASSENSVADIISNARRNRGRAKQKP